ncbi:MAG: AAA family ATPase [Planctomycetota bacterium]
MMNSENDFTLPPFPSFPSASRFVPIGPVTEAVNRVAKSLSAREAFSLVIGPPGTGKSLVCNLLAKQFAGTRHVIQLGDTPIGDETALFRMILHRLGVAFQETKHDELELLVREQLVGDGAHPQGTLLIVDEAASLHETLLESLRRLTNLMMDDAPVLSVVLAGGVKLDETLAMPSMEAFVQRIATRAYLHPLSLDETRQYVRDSIEGCQAAPDETITESAISAIYHATSGVPRLINQMMTEAIDCAADLGETLIGEHTIDSAWASLQQLPSPMIEEPSLEKTRSEEIEFGELTEPSPSLEMRVPSPESCKHEDEGLEFENAGVAQEPDFPAVAERSARTRTTDSISLFGEFDEEESLEIGKHREPVAKPIANVDLESTLHSQILGLSHFAAENTAQRDQTWRSDATEPLVTEQSDLAAEQSELAAGESDAPSVVWYDEPESDGDQLRDDQDLIWVTEDVEIEPKPGVAQDSRHVRIDDPDAESDSLRLNVDYREMLQKMRGVR